MANKIKVTERELVYKGYNKHGDIMLELKDFVYEIDDEPIIINL